MVILLHDQNRSTHLRPAARGRGDAGARSDPVVEVVGLVKSYGGERVVDGVSLSVHRGEIFGLLGANGAGKTTIVECLQGLRRPDGGKLGVLGLDPTADRGRLRSLVGSQLQDSALPDRLRVGEAIALFDGTRTLPVSEHLERWGLLDVERTSFGELSGGQRQRLFIVLALLNEPHIVFLDELTQGLDPAARREIWQVVRDVRDQGTTVVLVSHFAEEIEALCDRVAVLSRGRVIDTGTPLEVTDRHAPTTTVSFTRPSCLAVGRLVELGQRDDVFCVSTSGARLSVEGTSTMVGAACAVALDATGTGPPDLRVRHASLDDALVTLIGARP